MVKSRRLDPHWRVKLAQCVLVKRERRLILFVKSRFNVSNIHRGALNPSYYNSSDERLGFIYLINES